MAIFQGDNRILGETKYGFRLDRTFWSGFLAGSFYFAFIFRWILYTYPLDSFGIENKLISVVLLLAFFIASTAIMAVWWGVASGFGYRFVRLTSAALIPPVLAATFTLAEYLRTIFFSIFWYGDGGMIGPYWPIGNLAYLLVDLGPIASSASWWGIYGIEFWLIFFVSALVLTLFRKRDWKVLAVELVLLFTILIILWLYSGHLIGKIEALPSIPVAVIQTDVPSEGFRTSAEALDDFRKKLDLLERASSEIGEGIVIFPEGANFSNTLAQFLDEVSIQKYFNDLSLKELFIIDSVRTTVDDNFKSTAAFISSKEGLVKTYDKQILSPGGEFLPYIVKYPLILLNPNLRELFKFYHEYSSGLDSNRVSYGDTDFNIIVCSELKSPYKSRENNPDFITMIGSYSMWRRDLTVAGQDLKKARFRAIENGKYVVLASNWGFSYFIDPAGKVEKISNPRSYELLTGAVVPNKSRTWYNYVGDWPILLLSAAFFAVGLKKIKDDTES